MKKILVFLLALLSIFTIYLSANTTEVEAVSSTYYSGTENLTGTTLLNKLAEITKKNHTKYTSYDDIKTMNKYSDPDPKNSSNLLDFYSRISVSASWDGGNTWNREHVWPQSLSGGLYGTSGAGSDIHHIRPTISSINSSRGNKKFTDFDMISASGSAKNYNGTLVAYTNNDYWEPLDNVKGDTARIVMYMYMHYSKEVSENSSYGKAGSLSITSIVYGGGGADKAWDILLYWNKLDPVDDYEANRNDYCASVTGTRNPFIDNASFADAIWGDGDSSGGDTPDVPTTTYTVNYKVPNDATFNYSDNSKYNLGSKVKQPLEPPILSGHTFVGWYTDEKCTIEWDFNFNTITSNLTLYAKFIANKSETFADIFENLSIKSQLTFNVTKLEDATVSVPVDGTATINQITGSLTEPGDYDLKDYFSFDNSLFDIQYKKNSSTYSYIGGSRSQIRLYPADGSGNSIEITAKEGVLITSVTAIVDTEDSKISNPTITIDPNGNFASIQNTEESGQCRLNGFVINYQTNSGTAEAYKINDGSLSLKYVLQLNFDQYELFTSVASNVKLYINNEEAVYNVVKVNDEYRLVYSIFITDYSTVYIPKFTYGDKEISLAGYSAKTLAQFYLNNLQSDSLVRQYNSCLLEISE